MNFITAIPEGQAIINSRGVYRQVPIYERGGKIYAKYGAGFVRLSQGGATSSPSVRWAELDTPNGRYSEKSGSVYYHAADEGQALEAAE